MDKIGQFLEDKRFIDWVFHPDEDIERYWENYLGEHPEEKTNLLLARKVVGKFRTIDSDLSESQKIMLFSGILKEIERRQSGRRTIKLVTVISRYAAVALLFFSIGSLLFYRKDNRDQRFLTEEISGHPSGPMTTLIRPNGQHIKLAEDKSTFAYQAGNKKLVINDSIQVASSEDTPDSKTNEMNQLIVPYGKTSEMLLSDGTKIYLNAGSRLIYPDVFEGKHREVFLVGEAYFEVHKDPKHPFIVQTTDINVEVLGTHFNVSAYPSDNVYETTLAEGKVRIRQNNAGLFDKSIDLVPNQMAAYNRDNKETKVRHVDVENYILWKDGMLKFASSDFNRVTRKLERFYNIRITFQDPMVGMLKISGKLMLTEKKNEVMDVLSQTASVKIVQIGKDNYEIMKN
ncbi:FecR family protein [Prolixibacter denitrificans]|uniref:Anti-sigma factor n=1 Tax=Prolixibacter denitrificans TaxID=1541063 RepID=A0A2P8C6A4_9BACT|nr:FecR domain-containing protein [Prolixibacter denitrificans]PSK80498.1 FecR protein [Prolixibacter denitrificans]GET22725.1 anti-sigma factor [Prolixibacter denitrificans]